MEFKNEFSYLHRRLRRANDLGGLQLFGGGSQRRAEGRGLCGAIGASYR